MINIHPKAEPFFIKGNSTALLFIHGFTASPSELLAVAQSVHNLTGCTVSGILLPGHGSNPYYLNQTGWQDWYGAVEQELNYLLTNYERVYVAGLSLGGLLALHAAVKVPGLRGVIAINAPLLTYNTFLQKLLGLIQIVKPYYRKSNADEVSQLSKRGRFAYKDNPVRSLRSVLAFTRVVIRELPDLNLPTLIIQGLLDKKVKSESTKLVANRVKHKELRIVELKNSGHIATMGPEQDIIIKEICNFITAE